MSQTKCLIFFLLSASVWASAQAQPENDVMVHVNASRMVRYGNFGAYFQHLSATIEGKKYELESESAINRLLELGDYKARLTTEKHGKGEKDSWRVYELQLPEQKTRRFLVVGQLE